jgi:protein-S-isoprenylcysteine O-methyltransferase Ste14
MLVGTALRLRAICDLRQQFASTAVVAGESRRLVQSGIYRVLRHPSELGLLAAACGAACYLHSLAAAIGTCALLLTVAWRIRWEDEQLARAWPAEFSAYRRRVPALVPRLD